MVMPTSSSALRAAPVTRRALDVVRNGLLALSALVLIGAAAGLGAGQLIPWVGLTMLVVAGVLVATPGRRSLPLARVLCLVVLVAAAYGVAEYLMSVTDAAGIDASVTDYWASLTPLTRSWFGADDLGPHTPLVPGRLGQAALLILLATVVRERPATV
jgi:hypothetical protein